MKLNSATSAYCCSTRSPKKTQEEAPPLKFGVTIGLSLMPMAPMLKTGTSFNPLIKLLNTKVPNLVDYLAKTVLGILLTRTVGLLF
jgi:hypothetical protein